MNKNEKKEKLIDRLIIQILLFNLKINIITMHHL